ncbi:hypothetical protein ACC735_39005, partial [Rhizobium ruizarguesonis]
EGAPTPVTAFLAAAPNVAAMAMMTRIVITAFQPVLADWQRIVRHDRDIDADADDQCVTAVRQPLAFDENATGLLSADENIVRPF